jgi:hypothetical protein
MTWHKLWDEFHLFSTYLYLFGNKRVKSKLSISRVFLMPHTYPQTFVLGAYVSFDGTHVSCAMGRRNKSEQIYQPTTGGLQKGRKKVNLCVQNEFKIDYICKVYPMRPGRLPNCELTISDSSGAAIDRQVI